MEKFKFFEKSIDGVVVCNSKGEIIFWNDSLHKITGLKNVDVLGQKIWDIQDELMFQDEKKMPVMSIKSCWEFDNVNNLISNYDGKVQEFVIQNKDGLTIYAEQSFYTVNEPGEDFLLISYVRDISERKRKEEALHNYMNILNHDIRSPLSSLIGISELLMDEDYSAENTKQFATIINEMSNKMLKMVESYLLLEKIEKGKANLVKKPKTYFDILNEVKKVFTSLNTKNDVEILLKNPNNHEFSVEAIKKNVQINEILFSSMINNLITNAVEESSKVRGKIKVNIYENNNNFCLSVSNPGIIPDEIQKNLFKKFNTSKKSGTGLGLYSSRLIAQAHGGNLVYKSITDGTMFIVELPYE